MNRRVVAVEDPGSKKHRYDPAVSITSLLLITFIDAIIEMLEHARPGLESTGLSRFNREPDPVQHEQDVEDHDREAEVPC